MTPDEFDMYTTRYAALRDQMLASGMSLKDVADLEWPNCWMASEAGARCRNSEGCVASDGGFFPCKACAFEPS